MKHAYLIIAHNEFRVLQKLIEALDDVRNDIYVHIDKKVETLPEITTQQSTLFILQDRIDVRWGDVSQVEVMLKLFAEACKTKEYAFYHLLSGVHLPLKSQDYLHIFFANKQDKSFIQRVWIQENEIDMRIRRYNFFNHDFVPNQKKWLFLLRLQKLFHIKRYRDLSFYKASQWCSLNKDTVAYLVSQKASIIRRYQHTFCSDEFMVASELLRSPLKDSIVDLPTLLKLEFDGINPRIMTIDDYNSLIESDFLFARKFSEKEMGVVDKIVNYVIH